MDKQPWTLKHQQSVATGLERGDELLNNGNCDNLLETADINFNTSENKCDRKQIENDLEAAISEKSKIKIQNILNEVNTLIPLEKLLLYLKLPTETTNNVDPLRQPLNPLGSRTEISQTIMWIKTHLEEDPEISLQKKGVYDEYSAFCEKKNIKPLSTADFGKVMKQVYPKVRPRRLGTRGNSQYCYSGLRKRIKLATPFLPDLSHKPLSTESTISTMPDLQAAAWFIVKEWSEYKFGSKFQTLCYLAHYLVKNHSIGVGTPAASVVTSFVQNQHKGDMTSNINNNRHKETLKKIQQKFEGKDQKRKLQISQSKSEQRSRSKKARVQQQATPTVASTNININTSASPPTTITVTSTSSTYENKTSPSQGLKSVCDKSLDFTNLHALPDFSSFQRPCSGSGDRVSDKDVVVTAATTAESCSVSVSSTTTPIGKVPIPRLTTSKQQLHQQQQSPVLLQSPHRVIKNTKYKHIQPKPEQCDIITYNPQQQPLTSVSGAAESRSQEIHVSKSRRTRKKEEQNCTPSLDDDHTSELFTRERLISVSSVDKDALDDYLGTNNSQENEEELMRYFEQDNQEPESAKDKKLSQLRLLLEQNCQTFYTQIPDDNANTKCTNMGGFLKTVKHNQQDNVSILPTIQVNANARRRVSFDTHTHEDVPPSPNTRRKNFSFTPISPGSHSPTGRQSKCSSTNASPFVSPRNTPVPRSRGNSHPYPVNSSISVRKQFNLTKKTKHELELTIDHTSVKELYKNQVNLPMSAPPSPKINLLQNLLNSGQKFSYTPNYCSQNAIQTIDQLSPEVSTLLSRNMQLNPDQSSHRSQSVPLNADPTTFSHSSFTNQTNMSEFNEADSFSETSNINVNKIISTIDQTNLDPFLNETKLIPENEFIDDAMNLPIETDNYCQTDGLPSLRNRSQTLNDSTDLVFLKCNPSRSVPNTPVPYFKANVDSIKQEIPYSSRSYPSTPLANESFKYNQTQDYLLNGQPIKEKVCNDVTMEMNILGNIIDNKNDIVFDGIEAFNDPNLGNLIPSDHKANFTFGQIPEETNYGAKQNDPILSQECEIIENDYFRNDINRT